jgi:hypothetical protein
MGDVALMNTITEEQFLEVYKKEMRKFFDGYKLQEDPDDPIRLFWGIYLDRDIVERLEEEYRPLGEAAYKMRTQPDRELRWKMEKLGASFQKELQEWFAVAGYDEANVPDAPEIDHTTKRKMTKIEREAWQGKIGVSWFRGADAKTAYQIGQLVYTGSSSTSKGWADLYLLTGIRICHFHPNTSGVGVWSQELTEEAWYVAEKLSQLTDWSKFTEELPKKVRRVITKKIREIIDETGLREYSRLG